MEITLCRSKLSESPSPLLKHYRTTKEPRRIYILYFHSFIFLYIRKYKFTCAFVSTPSRAAQEGLRGHARRWYPQEAGLPFSWCVCEGAPSLADSQGRCACREDALSPAPVHSPQAGRAGWLMVPLPLGV